MRKQYQTALFFCLALLQVVVGCFILPGQAQAVRPVEFKVKVPTNNPGCQDGTPLPCNIEITGTRISGGCVHYDYGEDKGNFRGPQGGWKFAPITYWPGTKVTPAIFYSLGGTPNGGTVTVNLVDLNKNSPTFADFSGNSLQVGIGDSLPAGVPTYNSSILNPNPESDPPLPEYSGLINRMVDCVKFNILRISKDERDAIMPLLSGAVIALVSLAIAFMGIDMVFTRREARGPAYYATTMLIVVSVVTFTTDEGMNFYSDLLLNGQDAFVQIASKAMEVNTDPTNPTSGQGTIGFCSRSDRKYEGAQIGTNPDGSPMLDQQHRVYGIWERLDCIIATVFGAYIGNTKQELQHKMPYGDLAYEPYADLGFTNDDLNHVIAYTDSDLNPNDDVANYLDASVKNYATLISSSIIIGSLWSAWGPWVLSLFAGILITMLAAFVQAAFAYLISVVALVFLSLIGPIAISMALFKATRQGFMTWMQMVIGYMLQPAIIIGYLAFMAYAIDISIYGRPVHSDAEAQEYNQLLAVKEAAGELNAAQEERWKELEFPRKNSLAWYFHWIATDPDPQNKFSFKSLIEIESKTQDVAVDETGNNTKASAGNEKGDIEVPQFCFMGCTEVAAKRNRSEVMVLMQTILTSLLLFGLTYSFLFNVMQMAGVIVGLNADTKMMNANIYNKAVQTINQVTRGQ